MVERHRLFPFSRAFPMSSRQAGQSVVLVIDVRPIVIFL
jgi:hypothetical protein